MENEMINHDGNSIFRPYFCGKAWVNGGCIRTDMGFGIFDVEKKFTSICGGGLDMATWCVFNCSRAIRQTDAGALEWPEEDEDNTNNNMKGPLFMTYACLEGEDIQEGRDFASDLL